MSESRWFRIRSPYLQWGARGKRETTTTWHPWLIDFDLPPDFGAANDPMVLGWGQHCNAVPVANRQHGALGAEDPLLTSEPVGLCVVSLENLSPTLDAC